jgi:hypothetical protein
MRQKRKIENEWEVQEDTSLGSILIFLLIGTGMILGMVFLMCV